MIPINQEIQLAEIVISETEQVKISAILQYLNCDLYARIIRMGCEVYTLVKATGLQTISNYEFLVTNHSYRVPVVDSQLQPVLLEGEPLTIGNFDFIYKAYFETFQLRNAAQDAMISEFQKTENPLVYILPEPES